MRVSAKALSLERFNKTDPEDARECGYASSIEHIAHPSLFLKMGKHNAYLPVFPRWMLFLLIVNRYQLGCRSGGTEKLPSLRTNHAKIGWLVGWVVKLIAARVKTGQSR